jgi:chromosome segregation ATPase
MILLANQPFATLFQTNNRAETPSMALSRTAARQNGWLNQAESLVSTHRTVAFAGITAGAKARSEALSEPVPSDFPASRTDFESGQDAGSVELANNREPADRHFDEFEQQAVREVSHEQILHDQLEALAGQLAAAQQRIAELEASLGATYEQLDLRANETCSLQTSLDLLIGENSRLSILLTESEALRITAEKQLEGAQRSLRARASDNAAAGRDIAEAIDARDAAENKLEMLRTLLLLTDRQVHELEKSRSTLIEGASELLKTFETRDTALVEAEAKNEAIAERIAELESEAKLLLKAFESRDAALDNAAARNKALTERIAQLEAEIKFANKPGKFEELIRQWVRLERSRAETVGKTIRNGGAAPPREEAKATAPNGHSDRTPNRPPQAALAGTITFVNAG